MEEKERYELIGYCSYKDTETGVVGDNFVDLLNHQDARIKELEEENNFLEKTYEKLIIDRRDLCLERNDIFEENQQLREDLQAKDILVNTYMSVVGTLDNAKQLKQSQKQLAIEELEKLREYIVLNDEYDEEIGCNIIKTFGLIEDLADKIKSLKGEK